MSMDNLDRQIIEVVQNEFPIEPRPFQALAERLGTTEQEVLARIAKLQEQRVIREIGPVFELKRLGYISTLCAAKVAAEAAENVAGFLNEFAEVTHNYLRAHEYNIWFTLIASSQERIEEILERVRGHEGVADAVSLPAERTFKIAVNLPAGGSDS